MRSLILAILLSVSTLACASGQSEETAEKPIIVTVVETPKAAAKVEKAAPKADKPSEAKEDKKQPESEGFLDKALKFMKSLEALLAAIGGVLIALGVAAPLIAKLRKVREALHTVTHKIEQNKKKHKTATETLVEDIKTAAPKGTAVGAVVHAAAKEAERRVKNGG